VPHAATPAIAAAFGVGRAELADPRAAQKSTGYVVGAISPQDLIRLTGAVTAAIQA
jgi:prolyl-tRNA editing enzyme YbaK/EbsC (Cys-tRNA(Pro) deacylase)